MIRTATLRGSGLTVERVAAFLPSNYHVVGALVLDELTTGDVVDSVIISGEDVAGWTMQDYVLPRLASGCIYGTEDEVWDAETIANEAWSTVRFDGII